MKTIFWTADPHLDHAAIMVHTNRPFATLEAHNEFLVERWNQTVPSRGALVYVVGDMAWKHHAHWIQRLHGQKILVRGNHDKMNQEALRLFARVEQILVARKLAPFPIIAQHYPMVSWPNSHYGSWHVHGHSHGRCEETPGALRVDVGVDVWDYRPVPHELLLKKFELKMAARAKFYETLNLDANAEAAHMRQAALADSNKRLREETKL